MSFVYTSPSSLLDWRIFCMTFNIVTSLVYIFYFHIVFIYVCHYFKQLQEGFKFLTMNGNCRHVFHVFHCLWYEEEVQKAIQLSSLPWKRLYVCPCSNSDFSPLSLKNWIFEYFALFLFLTVLLTQFSVLLYVLFVTIPSISLFVYVTIEEWWISLINY